MSERARQGWNRVVHILTALRSREFLAFAWERFQEDRLLRVAASLSYTSLLAVVPLTAIAFAVLAAFPVFEGVREQIQSYLFANFLPATGAAVESYFEQFLSNTGRLTAVGIVGLALTAILLLNTIETAMAAIFRVRTPRPLLSRLLMFWAVLTLTPLLLGASLSLSTYIFALTAWVDHEAFAGLGGFVTRSLPTLMVVAALVVFYVVIPNRPVRIKDALAGAVVATLLFILLRKGFGLYVGGQSTFATLYGALAAVPIFLVWMYLTWAVVLLGAVLAASLSDWRGLKASRRLTGTGAAARLELALILIAKLMAASRGGHAIAFDDLSERLDVSEARLHEMLGDLKTAGHVENTADDAWVLARDPSSLGLHEFCETIGVVEPLGGFEPDPDVPWQVRALAVLGQADDAHRAALSITLRDLIGDDPQGPLQGEAKSP